MAVTCAERQWLNARNAFGEALVELGEANENIVVCDSDLSCSTKDGLHRW